MSKKYQRNAADTSALAVPVQVSVAMDEIAAWVVRLLDAGAAYRADDDVYFSVAAAEHFGTVSGYDTEKMLALSAERGGDPQRAGKKHPLDPLLWLAARPGEPSWESPLGPGRPGWHVECTAIAVDRLGGTLDVQGGRVFFHDTEFGVNWDGMAYCESTNNPKAVNNPSGYLSTYGLFQFDIPTWESVGGSGNPLDASPEEQLMRAKLLYQSRGLEPWLCGYAASGPPAG